MGLSPGWGDTYDYYRYEQWIDLGQSTLADGGYVLRSVTDAGNVLWESPTKTDRRSRGRRQRGAAPVHRSPGAALQTRCRPAGTVWINGVDTETSNTIVNLKVLGRDDVSGVDAVRISNDGVTWVQQAYTGVDSTPMDLSWNLADPATGGSTAPGPHTVLRAVPRPRRASGRRRSPTPSPSSPARPAPRRSTYLQAVNADGPVGYWRLGETCGTAAADERGANPGAYVNGPALASAEPPRRRRRNTRVAPRRRDDHVGHPPRRRPRRRPPSPSRRGSSPPSLPAGRGLASMPPSPRPTRCSSTARAWSSP